MKYIFVLIVAIALESQAACQVTDKNLCKEFQKDSFIIFLNGVSSKSFNVSREFINVLDSLTLVNDTFYISSFLVSIVSPSGYSEYLNKTHIIEKDIKVKLLKKGSCKIYFYSFKLINKKTKEEISMPKELEFKLTVYD